MGQSQGRNAGTEDFDIRVSHLIGDSLFYWASKYYELTSHVRDNHVIAPDLLAGVLYALILHIERGRESIVSRMTA
jgi:hypothetical protein